jgi:hypothetical protein
MLTDTCMRMRRIHADCHSRHRRQMAEKLVPRFLRSGIAVPVIGVRFAV